MSTKRLNPNPAAYATWHAPDGKVYTLKDLRHGDRLCLVVTPEHLNGATPRHPNLCALARCASAQSGGVASQIGRDKAYIPVYEDGKLVMYRCKIPAKTRRAIDHFDATGEFPVGGFWFVGICPTDRQDSLRAKHKRYRARWGSAGRGGGAKKQLYLRNASRGAQITVHEAVPSS